MFWASTLRELFREFAAARLRSMDDAKRDVTLAWNVVRITNNARAQKKVPSLQSLLRELDRSMGVEPHRQSVGQMKTMLHMLSAKYGIPLRKATKH